MRELECRTSSASTQFKPWNAHVTSGHLKLQDIWMYTTKRLGVYVRMSIQVGQFQLQIFELSAIEPSNVEALGHLNQLTFKF